MEETIASFSKTVVNADRTLPANDVVPKLKDQVRRPATCYLLLAAHQQSTCLRNLLINNLLRR